MTLLEESLDKWQAIRDRLLESAQRSVDEGNGTNAQAFTAAAAIAEEKLVQLAREVAPTPTHICNRTY